MTTLRLDMKDLDVFFGLALSALIILLFSFGWVVSASSIAMECRKLGTFYVSDKIYKCELQK